MVATVIVTELTICIIFFSFRDETKFTLTENSQKYVKVTRFPPAFHLALPILQAHIIINHLTLGQVACLKRYPNFFYETRLIYKRNIRNSYDKELNLIGCKWHPQLNFLTNAQLEKDK